MIINIKHDAYSLFFLHSLLTTYDIQSIFFRNPQFSLTLQKSLYSGHHSLPSSYFLSRKCSLSRRKTQKSLRAKSAKQGGCLRAQDLYWLPFTNIPPLLFIHRPRKRITFSTEFNTLNFFGVSEISSTVRIQMNNSSFVGHLTPLVQGIEDLVPRCSLLTEISAASVRKSLLRLGRQGGLFQWRKEAWARGPSARYWISRHRLLTQGAMRFPIISVTSSVVRQIAT